MPWIPKVIWHTGCDRLLWIHLSDQLYDGFKGEKGKNTYEIDLVGIKEDTKEILFCECKWQHKVNADIIINELSKKAEYVDWFNDERNESYAVFAKSFSKKITLFNNKKVHCYDLKEIENFLK